MKKNYLVSGQWNAICDSCGEKHKSGDLRKRWDGFMVCGSCYEPRHPQDFLRSRPDRQSVPWSRPKLLERWDDVTGAYDDLFITDVITRISDYNLIFTDSFDYSDTLDSLRAIDLTDTYSFTDNTSLNPQINLVDEIKVSDGDQYFAEDYMVDNYDYVSVGIRFTRAISTQDSFSFIDSSIASSAKIISDTFNSTDSLSSSGSFSRAVSDSLTFTDSATKLPNIVRTDSFTLTDPSVTSFSARQQLLSDSFSFTDTNLVKQIGRRNTTDTVTLTSSGTVNPPLYIESTYFSQDFVNQTQTIT